MPDEDDAYPVVVFAASLRRLWAESGGPPVRRLEALTAHVGFECKRSTIHDKLRGRTSPSLEFVKAFVKACAIYSGASGEPDLAPWEAMHNQLLRDVATQRKGKRRATEHARMLDKPGTVGRPYRVASFVSKPATVLARQAHRQPSLLLAARNRVVPFLVRQPYFVIMAGVAGNRTATA